MAARLAVDVLYPALGCDVRSQLGIDLARCDEIGNLHVDDKQRTSVEGLYAAGE
jgi:thioredoxin reductase (NADPH)